MDVLLTVVFLSLPSVISGLQTCSSGTETSCNQIILDVSTTQINRLGGACSCRLTVSRINTGAEMCSGRPTVSETDVEMFPNGWTQGCDTYITIPKWNTGTQCTNGVVQIPPAQSHTVTTDDEIWMLVVASLPGGLSGQLQFKLKSSLDLLNIECFEPNTHSSKTSPAGSTDGTWSTTPTATQIPKTTSQPSIIYFPVGILAAGLAAAAALVVIACGAYVAISRGRRRTSHLQKPDDIPISNVHPTYSGLTSRTEEPNSIYDTIDNPYTSVP